MTLNFFSFTYLKIHCEPKGTFTHVHRKHYHSSLVGVQFKNNSSSLSLDILLIILLHEHHNHFLLYIIFF